MPSLRQLLATHAPLLVLDAASSRVQVGWIEPGGHGASATAPLTARWESSDDEAGVGLFQCLEKLGMDPNTAGGFVFCDGPGSILGIRTVAIALRTWNVLKPRSMFSYSSLAVVAHALGQPDVRVIADARRDFWHAYQIGDVLRRVPANELCGELAMPEQFRHWSKLPGAVKPVPYSLVDLLPRVIDMALFRATDAPDAFLHEEPSYVTWTPQIHRAPSIES